MEVENHPCNCHQMIVKRKHHFSINTKTSSEVAMDRVKYPTTFKQVERKIKSSVTMEKQNGCVAFSSCMCGDATEN